MDMTNIVLISPYELGRQPFGLAQPARWLVDAGFRVRCCDLSIERLPADALADAGMVAIYLPMHTATRIAFEILPRIRALAPRAVLCAYGLYAPVNARGLRRFGVDTVIGGECEPHLLALAERMRAGDPDPALGVVNDTAKIVFRTPLRDGLPSLDRYAGLLMPDGTLPPARVRRGVARLQAPVPALPRSCPYTKDGSASLRWTWSWRTSRSRWPWEPATSRSATRTSSTDRPMRCAWRGPCTRRSPQSPTTRPSRSSTSSATPGHIETLAETGCLFLISAVESIDDAILERLAKGHTAQDFERAVAIARAAGLHLTPTFVPFTPWTTIEGYRALLERLVTLRLVESVPAVQLSIRLLVPSGSHLFEIDGFTDLVDAFDDAMLGYPWRHPDPAVDALQAQVQALAEAAADRGDSRRTTFEAIWISVHEALGRRPARLSDDVGEAVPMHSEPWYCCAEPTASQLAAV